MLLVIKYSEIILLLRHILVIRLDHKFINKSTEIRQNVESN